MGRSKLTTYKINKIKKLVNEGKTIKDIASELKISTATVANYRAYFKKKGEINIPNKQLISSENRPVRKEQESISSPFSEVKECTYIINGTKLSFDQKPKEIIFHKNKIIIEFQ